MYGIEYNLNRTKNRIPDYKRRVLLQSKVKDKVSKTPWYTYCTYVSTGGLYNAIQSVPTHLKNLQSSAKKRNNFSSELDVSGEGCRESLGRGVPKKKAGGGSGNNSCQNPLAAPLQWYIHMCLYSNFFTQSDSLKKIYIFTNTLAQKLVLTLLNNEFI